MKTATSCPACSKPVTLWRVMAAPTPWHLKCGACDARLRVVGLTGPAVAVAVAIALPLGWYAQAMVATGQTRSALVIAVGAIVIFELLMSIVLVNSATLEPKG
jgi:hypothetical protein